MYLSVFGQLGYFYILAIVPSAEVDIRVQRSCKLMLLHSWDICQELGLPGHVEALFLVFNDVSILLSIETKLDDFPNIE